MDVLSRLAGFAMQKKVAHRLMGGNPRWAMVNMIIRIRYFLGDIRTPDDANVK